MDRPERLSKMKGSRSHADVESLKPCVGCGALVLPDVDVSARSYVGASPGCWAIFLEILEKEYGDHRYASAHRLSTDSYMAQYPGAPSRRSIRSVAVHLIGLHLALEQGRGSSEATKAMQRAANRKRDFVWLDPPASLGEVTVLDVRQARNPAEHAGLVERWARSIWEAWSPHHETVRRWAQAP